MGHIIFHRACVLSSCNRELRLLRVWGDECGFFLVRVSDVGSNFFLDEFGVVASIVSFDGVRAEMRMFFPEGVGLWECLVFQLRAVVALRIFLLVCVGGVVTNLIAALL